MPRRWNFCGGNSIPTANSRVATSFKIVLKVLRMGVILIFLASAALAGGPKYVAGTTFFNSGTAGTPSTWSQGTVKYFTDQGNLSPILPGPTADAFVADAAMSDIPVDYLLSDSLADKLAAQIDLSRAISPLPLFDTTEHKDTVYITVVDG